jgi:hypothetical protein
MENKMQDLEVILAQLRKIVSPNFCNNLAKDYRFVQRSTSQLKGYEFVQSMMIPNAFLEAETLNSLAVRMRKINPLCNLSASALAQRINNKNSVGLMKAVFGTVLKEVVSKEMTVLSDLPCLSQFNRILIEDSTKIELHEKLSPHFEGSGGAASKAAVKLDYIFDYRSEKFIDIDFCSGNIPDQKLASRITRFLEKGDLVLRDLGYYAIERIKEVEKNEAYYISRLKSDVLVYASKDSAVPLDLAKFIEKNMIQGIVDVEIFIGKEKHPSRLVGCLMDEQAINKRQRDANRAAQRQGTTISHKKSSLLKYSLFITNVPVTIFSSTLVMAIYRARWRIELIFKQWKSCLKLHIFKGYNKERFHCFLYGRLIMILLLGCIYPPLMLYAQSLGCELSCFKLTNFLIFDHMLPRAFEEGKIDKLIEQLVENIPRRLCMDKRKRYSLRSNVRAGNSYYNNLECRKLRENVA